MFHLRSVTVLGHWTKGQIFSWDKSNIGMALTAQALSLCSAPKEITAVLLLDPKNSSYLFSELHHSIPYTAYNTHNDGINKADFIQPK